LNFWVYLANSTPWMLVFGERGKPKYREKKLWEQSRERTNSTHQHGQATAFTTAPTLLHKPANKKTQKEIKLCLCMVSGSRISQRLFSVLFPQAIIDGQKVKPGERAIYHQFFYYLFWHFSVCSFLSDH